MAGIADLRVPGQLAHGKAVAIGSEKGDLVALDLDPHTGQDGQGVASVSSDRHLGDGLGEDIAGDGATDGW
jgi:hypothetical protein